nr:hypothetical protein [Saprospiraceae bacterium]
MKKRLVLWGKKPEEERVLVAIGYDSEKNAVNTYVFAESVATEEFANQMMNLWREGNEVPFPEFLDKIEVSITEADRLIPEGLVTERDDLIDKAKAEWIYLYMSNKLASVYRAELEDLGEKIEHARRYEQSHWDELRSFWDKVQQQIREKNLFHSHYKSLKSDVNQLFDKLKALRKEMDDLLRKDSESKRDEFFNVLAEVEKKIEEGMGLKPLFEDLKLIQRDFQKSKMVRDHKNKVWKKLDGLFKEVKKKKFGDSAVKSGGSKLQRRYDGLLNAMNKMQNSINRDKKDLNFQDKRIESSSAGQLEAQIRKAKIKMIEERMRSKQVKLDEMQKVKDQLESRLQAEKEREEKRALEAEIANKKEVAKKKIEEEMKSAEEQRKAEEEKLKKAADQISNSKAKSPKKSSPAQSETKPPAKKSGDNAIETIAAISSVVVQEEEE